MNAIFRIFGVAVYTWLFIRELLVRRLSRHWPEVKPQIVSCFVAPAVPGSSARIDYSYRIGGREFWGTVDKRYYFKSNAETTIALAPDQALSVRYHPNHPEQSYLPLPISWWGFAYSFPMACFGVCFLGLLIWATIQDRQIEKHDKIPGSLWQAVSSLGVSLTLPGEPRIYGPLFPSLQIGR